MPVELLALRIYPSRILTRPDYTRASQQKASQAQ